MTVFFQKRGPRGKFDENGATSAAMNLGTLWRLRFARLGEVLVRIPGQRFFIFEKRLS